MTTAVHVVNPTNRRRATRRTPTADEPLSRVRLRAGRELAVIDLSNSGALVESAARLLPGTHVDVHMMTSEGRALVRSRVVRAYVSHLDADRIVYRGALAFDHNVDASFRGIDLPDVLLPSEALPDRPRAADRPMTTEGERPMEETSWPLAT